MRLCLRALRDGGHRFGALRSRLRLLLGFARRKMSGVRTGCSGYLALFCGGFGKVVACRARHVSTLVSRSRMLEPAALGRILILKISHKTCEFLTVADLCGNTEKLSAF